MKMNALWEIVQTRLVRRGVAGQELQGRRVEAGGRRHRPPRHRDSAGHPDRGGARDREVHQGQEAEEGAGGDPGRSGARSARRRKTTCRTRCASCASTTSASRCSSATTVTPGEAFGATISSLSFSSHSTAVTLSDRARGSRCDMTVGLHVQRQPHLVADLVRRLASAARTRRGDARSNRLEPRLQRRWILGLDLQREELLRLRLERFDHPQHARMNTVANTASIHTPTPAARPIASVDSMTPASFGSSIFAR